MNIIMPAHLRNWEVFQLYWEEGVVGFTGRNGTYKVPERAGVIKRTTKIFFSRTLNKYVKEAVDKIRKVDRYLYIVSLTIILSLVSKH